MRVREMRFWTALVVGGLSAAAMAQGWTALRFGLAEALADATSAESRLQPFTGDDLVGDLAERGLLRFASPLSPHARVDAVGALLGRTPLNGGAWLDLAIARRATGASMESVAAALALSTMTGPNEARLMAGRAVFALPFWSALPPDGRRALIADLVGGWGALDSGERARLSAILANARDRPTEDIRAALLLNGPQGAIVANALMPPWDESSPPAAGTTDVDHAAAK